MAWTKQTPGGGWKGCYRDPAGAERSRSFGKREKQKALRWAHDQEAAIRGGTYVEPKAGRVTLQGLFDEVHAARPYAKATLGIHAFVWGDPENRSHALHAIRHRRVGTITRAEVDEALARIDAPAVRAKTRALLSMLLSHAIAEYNLRENPAKVLRRSTTRAEKMATPKAKARRRYLTDDELARLAEAVPARYAALVRLGARVGLRPGEALALRVGKFDPMRRRLVIDTSVSGFTKTGEARELTLPSVIADELAAHLARYSRPKDPEALMFPSQDGTMLTVNGWRHTFQRAVTRAGLPEGLSPNDLRHSAVSWAISLGANVYHVQRMVGHAKPSITLDTYGELWDEGAEQLAERMDEALRGAEAPEDAEVVGIR